MSLLYAEHTSSHHLRHKPTQPILQPFLTPPRVLMYFTTFATFAAAITVPATIKPIAAAHFAIFHADGSAITGNVVFHQN